MIDNYNELESLLDKAEDLNWCSNVDTTDNTVEIQKHSPLGEDFFMDIQFDKDHSSESFLNNLLDYADSFDPDEHAAMWIEHRGKNGTPNSIMELIKDAYDIKDMISELYRYLSCETKDDNGAKDNISMEMNVGYLKNILKDLPDETPVFVACQGYCNYDFENNKPVDNTDTFAIVYDGKLFITDECAVTIDSDGDILETI